jgi:hypothetical protein
MDNFRKTLILCNLDYLLEDDDDDDNIIETEQYHQHILALYLMIHQSPYRNIHLTIHVNSIQQGGADFLLENADDRALEKGTHLNRFAFEMLYEKFEVYWKKGLAEGTHFGRIHHRVLNGRSALGLILFHMTHGAANTELFLFAGVSPSTISRYLHGLVKFLHMFLMKYHILLLHVHYTNTLLLLEIRLLKFKMKL